MKPRKVFIRRRYPRQHRPVRASRTAENTWSVTNYRGVTFTLSDEIFALAFRRASHG